MTHYEQFESPIGPLLVTSDGEALTGLYMTAHRGGPEVDATWTHEPNAALFVATRAQLQQYFAGDRRTFDLPLRAAGTPFHQEVWRALLQIPHGQTLSYGELALRLGKPNASRAVGLANGRNPLSIVVPCHRVIGADGRLTGYGGGVARKAWLLAHEQHRPLPPLEGVQRLLF